MKRRNKTLRNTVIQVAACVLGLATFSTQATPLNLFKGEPDITGFSPSVFQYDAGTQTLTIGSNGAEVGLSYQPNQTDPSTAFFGTWELTASVDNNGVLSDGSLVITNTDALNIPLLPPITANTTLLETELAQMGFQFVQQTPGEAIATFEFLGSILSSVPSLGFGTLSGAIVGRASFDIGVGGIDLNNPFAASFAAIDPSAALSDTFSVPTPAPLMLVLPGGVGMLWSKRRAARTTA